MNCPICGHDTRQPGTVTVTLARGPSTIVIRGVPADICENCGQDFVTAPIAKELEELANAAIKAGVQYEVRDYRSAA